MNHENLQHNSVQVYPFIDHYSLSPFNGIGIAGNWEYNVVSLNLVDSNDPNPSQTASTLIRRAYRDFRQIFSEIESERH